MWPFFSPPPPPPPATVVEQLAEVHSALSVGFYPTLFASLCLANHVFNSYLSHRTRSRLKARRGIPEAVKRALGAIDAKEYEKTRQYALAKNIFGVVSAHVGLVTTALGLYWTPLIWNGPAKSAAAYFGYGPDYEIVRMLLCMLMLSPFEQLFSLPLAAYRQLVLEEKFGMNNQSAKSWLIDALKSFVIETIMSALSMAPLVWTLRSLGKNAWFWGWIFITGFCIVFNMVYPVFIMPLFNTFSPMEPGPIRDAIEQLVAKTKLSQHKILVSDGSRQSAHSNAFVTGFFGVNRIVVYDTLLDNLKGSVADVTAVLAHEVGHAKMRHNYISLLLVMINLFMTFFTYGYTQSEARTLVSQFGYEVPEDETAAPPTFLTLNLFFMVFSAIVTPAFEILLNVVTRQLEFAADRFSADLGYDIRPPLKALAKHNMEDADPDPFVSLCRHSHPVTTQRVVAIDEHLAVLNKKAK